MVTIPEPALTILQEARTMRLATVSSDGSPNVAPFWYEFDGERFSFASVENATIRNLRRDPRATILVDVGDQIEQLRGVTVKGIATVHKPKEAPDSVKRAIRRMEERWAEEIRSPVYKAYVRHETRTPVLVEVDPRSVAWFDLGRAYREEHGTGGDRGPDLRRARPDEAHELLGVVLASARHWNYSDEFMERFASVTKLSSEQISEEEAWALDDQGSIAGFYVLKVVDRDALLEHLWLRPEYIGRGYGRMLFEDVVKRARTRGVRRMEWESDPNAVGFYVRMGARKFKEMVSELDRVVPWMEFELETAQPHVTDG